MRFRLGLFLGLAIGYVLGARAGRARYEQISRAWAKMRRSEPAQQLGADLRVAASRAGQTVEQKASEGVAKVTDLVRGDGADGGRAV
jgi:hypothetical protein